MQDDSNVSRRAVLEKSSGMGAAVGVASAAGGFEWPWGDDEDGQSDSDRSSDDYSGKRPVIFVHGAAGSGTQFESQAKRFSSNGYPDQYLAAFEYDSLSYGGGAFTGGLLSYLIGGDTTTPSAVHERLDERIDGLLEATGAEKVDAMGHSLGTRVMSEYLSQPERASKVAQYVALDGFPSDSPPGGVPTLGVWGLSNQDASIGGEAAENVHFEQTHVEVATSEETFASVYEFLTNEQPDTTKIAREPADEITLSGRVQLFPSNRLPADQADGATLEVYEIDDAGQRGSAAPVATPSLDSDGHWGPIDVDGSSRHEFAVSLGTTDLVHHHYRQPELRSSQFVRLLTHQPGSGTDRLIDTSDGHAAFITLRDKEFWGDQGQANDELAFDGTNVINPSTAPQGDRIVAPFVFDAGSDQRTNLDQQTGLFGYLPFLSGVDTYVPAASPPDDTVQITSTPRDGNGLQRTFTVPNWASSDHRVTLYLPDHTQMR
jgi:pimeloyl-ACP methyl ester carboxylesterase